MYSPFDTPDVLGTIQGAVGTLQGQLPQIESCFFKLALTVNGMSSGVLGLTRNHEFVEVSVQWCNPNYATLFSEITGTLTFSDNAPSYTITLHPESNWYFSTMLPFVDKNNTWLPSGTYTFNLQTTDYKLVGGVDVPTIGDVTNTVGGVVGGVSVAPPNDVKGNVDNTVKKVENAAQGATQTLQQTIGSIPPLPPVPSLPKLPSNIKLSGIGDQLKSIPDVVKTVKLNQTNFPPALIQGTINPQTVQIDVVAPDAYVDEGAVINVLITAPSDTNQFDRIKGKVTFSYTGSNQQQSTKDLTTNGIDDTKNADDVGRGTLTLSDIVAGTLNVKLSFDGNEIINGKPVSTLQTLNNSFNVNIKKHPVQLDVTLV